MDTVVFDPSLFAPECEAFVSSILEEGEVRFLLTKTMANILREGKLSGIFNKWDLAPQDFERMRKLIPKLLEKAEIFYEEARLEGSRKIIQPLIKARITFDQEAIDFLCDEMTLATELGHAIICASSSELRIVKFFQSIGASVKKTVKLQISQKIKFFETRKAKAQILAAGLGIALVFATGGPLGGFAALGAEAIKLIVVDP